jgi:FkbM family methyltransferase
MPLKARLYDPIRRALPRGLKRRLRPVYFQGTFTVTVDADHGFLVTTEGTRVENDLYWRGYGLGWEGMSLQLWRSLVPQARSILDIGAQTGIYALAARALNPKAVVIAFEPLESSYRLLRANVELNGFDIVTVQKAVSDTTGSAILYDVVAQHGLASLEVRPDEKQVALPVQTVRLDDFASEIDAPAFDLIKLDIEGHEPAAVRGLGDQLAASKPTLLIEILSDAAGAEIWNMVEPLGYEAYRIADRTGVVRADAVTWVGNSERNYLLCQPEALARAGLARLHETGSMRRLDA